MELSGVGFLHLLWEIDPSEKKEYIWCGKLISFDLWKVHEHHLDICS